LIEKSENWPDGQQKLIVNRNLEVFMRRKSFLLIYLSILIVSLASCRLTITSLTAPDTAETGEIITVTVAGRALSDGGNEIGIVLQIPEHWEVFDETLDSRYMERYTPEPGYKVCLGTQRAGISNISNTYSRDVKLLTRPKQGAAIGSTEIINIKAATGYLKDGVWISNDPEGVYNFSQISDDLHVEQISVTTVEDTTPPDYVECLVKDYHTGSDIQVTWYSYDEASQKDVLKYRIYSSMSPSPVLDFELLVEVPAGQFSYEVSGLTPGLTYYYIVTAVDELNQESEMKFLDWVKPTRKVGEIAGTVYNATQNIPLPGAEILLHHLAASHDIISAITTTDKDGRYSFNEIPEGRYKLFGYISEYERFDAFNIDVFEDTVTTKDLFTNELPYISGHVKGLQPSELENVTLTFSNHTTGPVTVNPNSSGFFIKPVNSGWSGTITPSKEGYTFYPSSLSYADVNERHPNQDFTAYSSTHFISGYIYYPGSTIGMSGATVAFSDGKSEITNNNGYYSHEVQDGWSGTVTPSIGCYSFTPSNIPYSNLHNDQSDQNYNSEMSSYSISGYVRESSTNSPMSDVTLSFSNGGGSVVTNNAGYYTKSFNCGWSGTVTISKDGFDVNPQNRLYTDIQSNKTNQNYYMTYIFEPQIQVDPISLTISKSPFETRRTLFYEKTQARNAVSGDSVPDLFSDIDPNQLALIPVEHIQLIDNYRSDIATIQSRIVEVNNGLLKSADAVNLSLFDGSKYLTYRTQIDERYEDNYSWFGEIAGSSYGNAVFVVKDNKLNGAIQTENGVFSVRSLWNGYHIVIQKDVEHFVEDATSEAPLETISRPKPRSAFLDDGSEITVMVAYTPAAADGHGDIESHCQLAVDVTNRTYFNSDITPRLKLVHTCQVAYTEANDAKIDLDRLRSNGDGYMDEIHGLRDSYSADIVVLLFAGPTLDSGGKICGRATLNFSFKPEYAFAVVDWECAISNFSFAHEIGHIQNARHNPEIDSKEEPFVYGHGYLNTEDGWRTIMAYDNREECLKGTCRRLANWSNPDKVYRNDPMGTSSTHDNARVLNETAVKTANFRVSKPDGSLNIFNKGNESLVIHSISKSQNWLTLSDYSTPFSIPPGGSKALSVDVNWEIVGSIYEDIVTISSNDPDSPSLTIPVTILDASDDVIESPYISVMPAYYELPPSEGTGSLMIDNIGSGSMSWTATTYDPWIEILNNQTGTDNGTLIFSYEANNSTEREGQITISSPTASNSRVVAKIKQASIEELAKGDVNNSGGIDLEDAILALKVSVGIDGITVYSEADVNLDYTIGIQDAIFILQKIANL
jgi:hypothetical protein